MVVSAIPAVAAAAHECPAGKVTAASYTHDFKSEASTIFQEVQSDAQDAILFGDAHQQALWLAPYRTNLDNLYTEAKSLTRSAGNAVELSSVSKEYRNLRHNLEPKGSS